MTSPKESSSLTRTSNIDFVIDRGSTYDIVEFACGSRSMRRVLKPLFATAAERLMAVVVLPTPPFWLATVMIIGRCARFYVILSAAKDLELRSLRSFAALRMTEALHLPLP